MTDFTYIIEKLLRKKEKAGKNGYWGKPIIEQHENMLIVQYNFYHVVIVHDEEYKMPRPLYRPYLLNIEKPCIIQRGARQEFGTAFSREWLADQEELWYKLQSRWARTIK